MHTILPVIMAGGSGSRLWPMSRVHFPKQFLSLMGQSTMLQETVSRLHDITHLPCLMICNEEHRFLVAEQLRQANLDYDSIILEPQGRNTAPAIASAALKALKDDYDPLLLVLAADHLIKDITEFAQSIKTAVLYANDSKLVTFGIVGNVPETAYGYIRRGSVLCKNKFEAYDVDSFVEKPDLQMAKKYLASNQYYWNSGMFLFKASRYIEELKKFRPDILQSVETSLLHATYDFDFIRLEKEAFNACPEDSIDYAVMEKTSDAVVVPLDAGWSDIGSWASLWEVSDKDKNDNVITGDVLTNNSHRCYINSPERLVATVGVDDLIIIDTKDALLVANRNKVQDVKNIVSTLKEKDRKEFLHHREIYRPWGKSEHISEGEHYYVRKVVVKPGMKTAMQLHYHRSEHWIVVSGTAKIYYDSKEYIVNKNESIYIPIGIKHCFENPGKIPLEVIEIRTGCYLQEDDIVRVSSEEEY